MLVPLVTHTQLLDFVIETVASAREELAAEGLDFGRDVPLGVMIEVAAAATMVGTWAAQVDFFALGTNDLVASALGLDRDEPRGADLQGPVTPRRAAAPAANDRCFAPGGPARDGVRRVGLRPGRHAAL